MELKIGDALVAVKAPIHTPIKEMEDFINSQVDSLELSFLRYNETTEAKDLSRFAIWSYNT